MSRRALALAAGGVAVAAAAAIGIVIGTGVAAGRPARPGTRGWSRAPSGWRTKTVDAAGFGLHGTVPTGKEPAHVYVSPDGRSLLVANQGTEERPSATVTIVDTQTFRAVRTVETGQGAHGVVVEPTGRHAYITNTYGGNVAVLDLVEQRVVARIPVGQVPTDRPPATIELPLPRDGDDGAMDEEMDMG